MIGLNYAHKSPDGPPLELVGEATVYTVANNSPCRVLIKKIDHQRIRIFVAIHPELDALLGGITLLVSDEPDTTLSCFISMLKACSPNLFRGTGTALIKAALEDVLPLTKNVTLDAANNSHGFFYRRGFRTNNSERNPQQIDTLIAKELNLVGPGRSKSINFVNLGLYETTMYLPESSVDEWKAKIRENPTLFVNRTPEHRNII